MVREELLFLEFMERDSILVFVVGWFLGWEVRGGQMWFLSLGRVQIGERDRFRGKGYFFGFWCWDGEGKVFRLIGQRKAFGVGRG